MSLGQFVAPACGSGGSEAGKKPSWHLFRLALYSILVIA